MVERWSDSLPRALLALGPARAGRYPRARGTGVRRQRRATRDITFTRFEGAGLAAGTTAARVADGDGRLRHADRQGASTPAAATSGPAGRRRGRCRRSRSPSWSRRGRRARPATRFVEVEVRGRNGKGVTSSWDLLGRWAAGDKFVRRTTDSPQSDDLASVDVDTWKVQGTGGLVSWQLRVSLYRKAGTRGPTVSMLGAMASRLPRVTSVAVSAPGPDGRHRARRAGVLPDGPRRPLPAVGWRRRGVVLAHLDLDGARLLRRAAAAVRLPLRARRPPRPVGRLRRPRDLRRRLRGHRQLAVQHRVRRPARRRTRSSPGCGRCARPRTFVAAGIPLVASVSWGAGELTGAPVSSSNGHLLVIVGFTADGDPVVNDPAAKTAGGVRRVYDRARVRERLAAQVRRHRLRHPRRRPPAAACPGPGQLVARDVIRGGLRPFVAVRRQPA